MASLLNLRKSVPIAMQHRKHPFLSLQSELDKTMTDLYNLFEMPRFSAESFDNLTITPVIDIVDDKENFKVEAEMPGLNENDVRVTIGDGVLTIKAEKKSSKKDSNKNYILREIGYGAYERSIALPDYLDVEKAKASFKNGMLWVNIPKTFESSKRTHELQIEKVN